MLIWGDHHDGIYIKSLTLTANSYLGSNIPSRNLEVRISLTKIHIYFFVIACSQWFYGIDIFCALVCSGMWMFKICILLYNFSKERYLVTQITSAPMV